MITPIVISDSLSVTLRVKDEPHEVPAEGWACLRFLGEEEVIELLSERLDKSEAEVRRILESYDRSTANA